ncbi:hypothetical protein AKJ16_DCAP20920 [Drosera capensis]
MQVVDADDLVKGTYTIDDVVLPLPGSRAIYPANDIADIYHDLAGKDKISLTENAHNVKEILTYTDGNRPLAETDLDIILKSKASNGACLQQGTADGTKFNHSDSGILSDVRSNEEASKTEADCAAGESDYLTQTALKLQFTLAASSYATMAIRELLKASTSVAFHKTLNHRT